LKKLNLSKNSIETLWEVPSTLEILNLSHNNISNLTDEVTVNLKSLFTLDISFNKLESLQGFQNMNRLKRALFKNNQVTSLEPLKENLSLIEIDAEQNLVPAEEVLDSICI
jgi:Leucine-rich repeat (LRR) protein